MPPPDVSLLLRTHAEQRWLSREVIPVLRQVETREDLPEDQFGAALAYLEVIWLEAMLRARETDAACDHLGACRGDVEDETLCQRAVRYYSSVKALRHAAARRVAPVLASLAQYHAPTSV